MSSEYGGEELQQQQQPEDAYTRMWENVDEDEDWLFDPGYL